MTLQDPPPRTPRKKGDVEHVADTMLQETERVAGVILENTTAQEEEAVAFQAGPLPDELWGRAIVYSEPQQCYGRPVEAAKTIRDLHTWIKNNRR